jgi:hypothetical protein
VRYWVILVPLLLSPAGLGADELILRDGKNITWKSITDDGATLTVVTTDGKKMVIRKEDVDTIVTQPSKDAPAAVAALTGASITFDKKKKLEVVDLLAMIDPKRDGITGAWNWGKQRSLVGAPPTESTAKCQIPYLPPAEYDLTVTLERKDGGNGINFGLVSPLRQQFMVSVDVMAGTASGFNSGEGEAEDKKAGRYWPGKFFTNGKPRTLTFMVRKDSFVFQADGKDFMTYRGDWTKVPNAASQVQKNDCLFFVCYSTGVYDISRIILTAPKEKS